MTSAERAQVLATRQKIQDELDSLWRQITTAADAAENGDMTWGYVDGLERQIEDTQDTLAMVDRLLARG
jgi:HPt (histidine-containing phosphotransfer) domain-containing protein